MPYLQGTYRVSISKSLYGKWVPVLWLVDTHTHTHTPRFSDLLFLLSLFLAHTPTLCKSSRSRRELGGTVNKVG